MPNKSYLIGYRFEVRVKKFYEKQGCLVWRLPKSRFPDLLVWMPEPRELWGVECKVNKYISKEEKGEARRLVEKGLSFIVAYRKKRKLKFWEGNIYE